MSKNEKNEKAVKAVKAPLGREPWDHRWVIVNEETGEVLDDAQGYGYKSPQKAYAAWGWKSRSPEKKAREKTARKAVRKFLEEHEDVEEAIEQVEWDIAKGAYGPGVTLNAKMVSELLDGMGYKDLPFTASELLRYS